MDNIFGERFLGRREPAWHGLGTVFHGPIDIHQALEKARIDFEYGLATLYAHIDGVHVPIDNKRAVYRTPTSDDQVSRVLSVVGKNYGLVQNRDIATLLEPLTDKWPVETVGALGHGEIVFITLDAGQTMIAKRDPVDQFFLVTDSKDAKGSLDIRFTPVRVVCANTLSAALGRGEGTKLSHHRDIKRSIGWAGQVAMELQSAQHDRVETMNVLAEHTVSHERALEMFANVYRMPEQTANHRLLAGVPQRNATDDLFLKEQDLQLELRQGHMKALRSGADELYIKFGDEHDFIGATLWAVYNAVCEVEDYRKGDKGRSAVFGSRAQTKEYAWAMVTKEAQE